MPRFSIAFGLFSLVALAPGCSGTPATSADDAAVVEVDAPTAPPDAFATALTCTSGTRWTNGDRGSILMHPGGACNTCHATHARTPRFSIAGTVYPSAHEPDDCNGSDGLNGDEIHIVVTDSTGLVVDVLANQVGNFYDDMSTITPPITAEVRYQGRTRTMDTPAVSGDCNTCHTADGVAGAPGRIVLP